jgi:peptidoglycan pentaglycine glycine transferase (the first glycine)
MGNNLLNFVQSNSPDGGFLQSEHWRNFQQAWGRKTQNICVSDDEGEFIAFANIIEHTLPIVGSYFYVPRGPIVQVQSSKFKVQSFFKDIIELAKKNKIGWVRIDPSSEGTLDIIKENLPGGIKIKKSAVDMQPREILVLDISKSGEDLLGQMKQKTRYNIRLAEKKGVCVSHSMEHGTWNTEQIEEFLKLVKITSERDKIASHPENYYRKMFEVIPSEILKIYVAEYEGKVIGANLVLFFGNTATYMHGASDNEHRNVMAPYLLQWQQILDAKKAGCVKYDLGGVKTHSMEHGTWNKSWEGLTRFKAGFAPDSKPIEFPGSYDAILNPTKYNLYRFIQKAKKIIR